MDFFEQVNERLPKLNANERKLFSYVLHNIQDLADRSIRQVAQDNYVSTTTVIRFVKKLGFGGYRDFSNAVRIAVHNMGKVEDSRMLKETEYMDGYLKNIVESLRVLPASNIEKFAASLEACRNIYFYGNGLDRDTAHYAYRIFTALGYSTYFPADPYEVDSMLSHISDGDILFIFSLTGESKSAIEVVETARLKGRPKIVSITWSGNNTVQNLSDLDFYIFTDRLDYGGYSLTSRISMVAIVDMLAYRVISGKKTK